jgi:hypothetical protein
MEQLHDGGVFQQGNDNGKILDGEGVDHGHLRVGGQLQQAQIRVIGLLAQKLGIDGQNRRRGRAADESLEVFLVRNVFHVGPCSLGCPL